MNVGRQCHALRGIPLTRAKLKELCADLDKRFRACLQTVADQLQAQSISVDRAILIGGSSRLVQVPQLVQDVFGLEPARDVDPDLVVAKGAAIWSQVHFADSDKEIVIGGKHYLASQIQMATVAAHAICVAAFKDRRDKREYNMPIVPANIPLPHEFKERFSPVNPAQPSVLIKIVQGQPEQLTEQATLLHEIKVPIQPTDQDSDRILVQGRYTEEGLLEITVMDELTGQRVSDSFNYQAGLTEAEIDEQHRQFTQKKGA